MTKLWKWGKRLLWVLAGLFILLILSVSILVYLINSEAFLEKQIQTQLGMSSQVGELDVSLFAGTISIAKTRVGPEGNPAITFDKLTAEISYTGLFSSLLIDSIELDKAVIRYPFEYQLPETVDDNNSHDDRPFFFERLNIAEIRIKNSDFVFDDEVRLEAIGVNLVISDLPVAEQSTFLFATLNDFFIESNTTITADIDQLVTDKSKLNKISLRAKVLEQDVIIEDLSSFSADINIDLPEPAAGSTANSTSTSSQSSNPVAQSVELLTLPFKDLLVETIDIGTTNFKLQGQYQLSVNDLRLEFSQLILVKDKVPLWNEWQDFYQQQNSHYTLSSGELSSELISFNKLSMDGNLVSSTFDIKELIIESPTVNYLAGNGQEANQNEGNHQEDSHEEGGDTSQPVDASADKSSDIHLPFASVLLQQLTISKGSLNLELDDSYKAQSINADIQQLPVIADYKLVIAKPELWGKKLNAKLEASDISLPQVEIAKVSADIESESGNVLLSPITIDGANLQLDLANTGEASDSTGGTADSGLPINQILMQNIQVNQLDFAAKLPDDNIKIENMVAQVADFTLIKDKTLFSLDDLNSLDTTFTVTADSVQTKQLLVRSLSANGNLAEGRLVLENLANQSGQLTLDLSNPAKTETSSEQVANDTRLPLKSVVVNSLKLRNFNGDVVRLVTSLDIEGNEVNNKETLKIQDLDFTASRLWLVKNNQMISAWYDSQLEDAFKDIELKVAQIQQDEDSYSNINIKAIQTDRKVAVNPLTVRVNETELTADWLIDLAKPGYSSHFDFDFQNLDLGKLIKPDNENSIALRGKIDGVADLTFTGLTTESIFSSLNGQILLTNNEPVQMVNININKVLERFLESQEFGLLDIGGFVLAGPAGLLLSQGVSMQGVLSNLGANKGDTMFGQIHVDMTIENGILKTRDVAASTQLYRFAFDGNIDLSIMAFNNFEFMILSDEGCKEYSQTLNGSISSPEIQTFRTAFDAVTGSVVGLLKSGVGLFTGGYCEGVYDGKVAHPEEGVEIPHPEIKPEELEDEG